MKLSEFKKKMQKPCFSVEEAKRVAWETSASVIKLELSQWSQKGEVIRLKKGLYCFPEKIGDRVEIARFLYEPAYLSLEYALNIYGLLPDIPFALTLVTPRTTRRFKNPFGQFIYHHVQKNLFWGYDPQTLMGEKEKALLDYFYLYSSRLVPKSDFWETARFQNLKEIDFKKLKSYAVRYQVKKVGQLVLSLEAFAKHYGKSQKNY